MEDITSIYFSTFTNLNWQHVLKSDSNKEIVIESLRFLVKEKRIVLYGFVIMPNHIHLLWKISEELKLQDVQRDFLKFTAQKIKFRLLETEDVILEKLMVNAKDRKFQIWERNGFSFMLNNVKTVYQKLNYIHYNPLSGKWKLAETPADYFYSSASFYDKEIDKFGILSHVSDEVGDLWG